MARTYSGSSVPYDNSDPSNHPNGQMKNDTTETSKDGTPIYSETLDDSYQAHMELMRLAGITPDTNKEAKGASQIADAIGFLNPVMILKCGYDGTYQVLKTTAKTGWTAEYTTDIWSAVSMVAGMKLTIKKDTVVYAGALYVQVGISGHPVSVDGAITVGSSNTTDDTFDNDDTNIYIAAPFSATATQDQVQQVPLIITVFKAD